jgi:hypothetical protein
MNGGRSHGPLTAGALFNRGFRRIGTIAAVLVSLFGVGETLFTAWSEYNAKRTTFENATCVAKIVRESGRAVDQAKIAQARKEGYSDDEILNFLWQKSQSELGCSKFGLHMTPLEDVLVMADGPAPSFLSEGGSWLGSRLVLTSISAIAAFLAF